MPVTVRQLQAVQKRYDSAKDRAEVLRLEREELVRQAAGEGWTQQAIGAALGISQVAARKILKAREGSGTDGEGS